tara:strand:+ start:1025 stop:1903 length:879 start_codon:yes stop_codon:yes gene_type:complete
MVNLKDIIIGAAILFFLFYKDISYHYHYEKWNCKGIDSGDSGLADIKTYKYIPKVVYKTGIDDYNNIHPNVREVFSETIKQNPGFKIKYYSDNDSRDFIKNNFSNETLITYDKLIPGAYKADLFRYCILYMNGGIYSDLTQRFTKPFNEFIDFKKDNLYLVEDKEQHNIPLISGHLPQGGKLISSKGIQISFIASRPGNEIFKSAIDGVIKNVGDKYYGTNPLHPTGPAHFYKILQDYNGSYQIGLKETGMTVVNGVGETIIINKINNHHSVILRNKDHYSRVWANRGIYRD